MQSTASTSRTKSLPNHHPQPEHFHTEDGEDDMPLPPPKRQKVKQEHYQEKKKISSASKSEKKPVDEDGIYTAHRASTNLAKATTSRRGGSPTKSSRRPESAPASFAKTVTVEKIGKHRRSQDVSNVHQHTSTKTALNSVPKPSIPSSMSSSTTTTKSTHRPHHRSHQHHVICTPTKKEKKKQVMDSIERRRSKANLVVEDMTDDDDDESSDNSPPEDDDEDFVGDAVDMDPYDKELRLRGKRKSFGSDVGTKEDAPKNSGPQPGSTVVSEGKEVHLNICESSDSEVSDEDEGDTDNDDALSTSDLLNLSPDAKITNEMRWLFWQEARKLGFFGFLEKYHTIPLRQLFAIFELDKGPRDIPPTVDPALFIPALRVAMAKALGQRRKRPDINTIEDTVKLLREAKKIIVLTGAGVSVSCGIPDFRSENGIYSRLEEFDLDDPQQMFDLDYFKMQPRTFYSFAKEIYPSNFKPSPSHLFIKLLEDKGKLLRNYTQNIDTLESVAGIERVVQCHGSFKTASCITCGYSVPGNAIEEDIFAQRVPYCPRCVKKSAASSDSEDEDDYSYNHTGIMKPDIVFFGEKLPNEFDLCLMRDIEVCDLLIVMGSSLKVSPVADVKDQIPHHIPQILINMEALPHMGGFDVQLLGYCDEIVAELCRLCGWQLPRDRSRAGGEDATGSRTPLYNFEPPNRYHFRGAKVRTDAATPRHQSSSGSSMSSSSSAEESAGPSGTSLDTKTYAEAPGLSTQAGNTASSLASNSSSSASSQTKSLTTGGRKHTRSSGSSSSSSSGGGGDGGGGVRQQGKDGGKERKGGAGWALGRGAGRKSAVGQWDGEEDGLFVVVDGED